LFVSLIDLQVVIAVILVWLWAQHKESFQRAFVKSGRIDVDPECKWLIQTAVDAAVRALMLDIADTVARGGSMAMALGGGRSKGVTNGLTSSKEGDRQCGSSFVDVHVARLVSQGLMGEFCMDESVVSYRTFPATAKELLELTERSSSLSSLGCRFALFSRPC
jgi:hypothetical protein